MITGATRGTGYGGALARHLLKAENEAVVIPARGLGSTNLPGQITELVAMSAGGRTDRPVYHVFCSPDPAISDNPAARARFWTLFEVEFGLTAQPFCGVEHDKVGRLHEHRVYSVVRPCGAVVDLSWDYARREKCSRIVEREFGMPAVPSKHARAIAKALRRDGRHDVADWLVASGTTESIRPVSRATPRERLIEERSGIDLDGLRKSALAAWRETDDGPGFMAALRARGLDLRRGRVGPVVVDASGTAHLATRILGAAARRFEGERIPAATVKDRLNDLKLEGMTDGRYGDHAAPGRTGQGAPRDPGPVGTGGGGYDRSGVRRLGGDAGRPDGGRVGRDGRGPSLALGRLRSTPSGSALLIRRRLNGLPLSLGRNHAAVERARRAAERIDAEADHDRQRGYALWGLTDIWGIPLQ